MLSIEGKKKRVKEVHQRIIKLQNIEDEINKGFGVSITRLTVLKTLCKDSFAMCEFAYEIVKHTELENAEGEINSEIKDVAYMSIDLMENIILASRNEDKLSITVNEDKLLYQFSIKLREYQNEMKSFKWSNVRIIKDEKILLIEEGLNCFINPEDVRRGYEIGKRYTEKYDCKFGTGLIPESKEYLKIVIKFWTDYYSRIKEI